jgi:cytochrome c oxidase subunit II
MDTQFQLVPEQASTLAPQIDALFYFLTAVTAFFTIGIFVVILYLGLKYRRRTGIKPQKVETNVQLEIAWTVIPLVICMFMFGWAAKLFVQMETPPADAMEINVIGKQWMWKVQHPEGPREINTLHVPVGRPIKLTMTSQDVIHSFYIPAFRVKQDVVPGKYLREWFTPTKVGEYHLFCAEYCGAQHSGMIGSVIVMEPSAYQSWLSGTAANVPMVLSGERLFAEKQCNTCHGQRAPTLAGIYGRRVLLNDGSTIVADENYLRESILQPNAKMVAGYPPIMPTYQGQLTEEQITELIAYVKSLSTATTQPSEH